MPATTPIVKIQNVNLTYNAGKPTEFKALHDINLEIYPEEFVIFFGPSGSGKSTLLYLIAGLEMATEGTVSVASKPDITKLNAEEMIQYHRSSIGMIFQAFYLVPSLTAKDNVLLPMVFAGVLPEQREAMAQKLLGRFGITDFENRNPARLSGGQQQRVAIARSLVNDPAIVLADEPVGNLDSKNAEIVLDLIADLKNKDKKTVILVTHDPSHLHKADRVFYIKDGRIVKVVENTSAEINRHGYEAFKEVPAEGKGAGDKEAVSTETLLEKLVDLYPNVDRDKLMAKILVHSALMPYDIEMIENAEELVKKFIKKEITAEEMYKHLDNSEEKGGLGFYAQTAQKLVKSVVELNKEIKQVANVSVEKFKHESSNILEFLIEDHPVKLSVKQKEKIREIITMRLDNKIGEDQVQKLLDTPQREKGVGLNSRTAEHFAKRIELIIIRKKNKNENK
jgi:putative ABC transport system ATP-binding protein